MFALNFGVSFACALFVALRARQSTTPAVDCSAAILLRFVREPLPFLLPVGRDATTP